MLVQFAVENYKSFRERTVWDLRASAHTAHHPRQVTDIPGVGPVLRIAGLYGANASGKSNLIEAWFFFCQLALRGRSAGAPMKQTPFKLAPQWLHRGSAFEMVVSLDGTLWTYGVEINSEHVTEEWLLRRVGDDDLSVFERRFAAGGRPAVTWGPGLQVESVDRRAFLSFVAEGTRQNQPLLAECFDRNAEEFGSIYWFLNNSSPRFSPLHEMGGPSLRSLIEVCVQFPDVRAYISQILSSLGTGVTALTLRADSVELQRILDLDQELDAAQLAQIRFEEIQLEFLHNNTTGEPVAFSLSELSDGTRRLLGIALGWYWLEELHETVFIDELDRSFHPTLTRTLLASLLEFPKDAHFQLLFTTHDTNLLDAGLLGADGIWFVEKDAHGASQLYSLAEFQPEQLDALTGELESGYLQGRFGAIPFIGDPNRLGWSGDAP